MRRVVVTGMGIVSSLGNDVKEVTQSLKDGKSGIQFCQDYAVLGMRSHIAGRVSIDQAALIDRKKLRFMGDAAAYSYVAMQQAIEDAGLDLEEIKNPKVGLITGSGGGSPARHKLLKIVVLNALDRTLCLRLWAVRPLLVCRLCLVFKVRVTQLVLLVQRVPIVLVMRQI